MSVRVSGRSAVVLLVVTRQYNTRSYVSTAWLQSLQLVHRGLGISGGKERVGGGAVHATAWVNGQWV